MSLDISLKIDGVEVYESNITHNLTAMASAVSEFFYKALWRPEEMGLVYAEDVLVELRKGAAKLVCAPTYYKQFNASNGWGLYEHFVPFVVNYIEACEKYPRATVSVWR